MSLFNESHFIETLLMEKFEPQVRQTQVFRCEKEVLMRPSKEHQFAFISGKMGTILCKAEKLEDGFYSYHSVVDNNQKYVFANTSQSFQLIGDQIKEEKCAEDCVIYSIHQKSGAGHINVAKFDV